MGSIHQIVGARLPPVAKLENTAATAASGAAAFVPAERATHRFLRKQAWFPG
jgi:hypothetical protein